MAARIAGYTSFVASGQAGFPPAQSLNRTIPVFAPAVAAGDAILIFASNANGGVAGGAITFSDNVNAGNYTKLLQIDDTGSGQSSWYLYAMFNSQPAAANTLAISAVFTGADGLIWQGIFAFDVTGVTASPLITAAVGAAQAAVSTAANAISSGNIAAGSNPAILIAGTQDTTTQAATGSGPETAGSGFIQYIQDLNWNTSGTPGAGPEGTPDSPTACFEYLVSNNPGTIPARFTAFPGGPADNFTTIVVALQASPDIAPTGRPKRRGRQGGNVMGLNVAEWF